MARSPRATTCSMAAAIAVAVGAALPAGPAAASSVASGPGQTRPAAAPALGTCTSPAEFNGIAALTSADAWAVGNCWNGANPQGLIEHWNGHHWTAVTSPDPGGMSGSVEYESVAAVSASDAWAVGSTSGSSGQQTLIAHWHRGGWRHVASPSPGTGSALYSVTAISATDIWAVGSQYNGTSDRTLIVHWNGHRWSAVKSPDPGKYGDSLHGVGGSSAGEVWAVGFSSATSAATKGLILRWNGHRWSVAPSPSPAGSPDTDLAGVAARSGSDAWAVGTSVASNKLVSLILHWNGKAWRRVASPNPGGARGSVLSAIVAVSRSSAWAVGNFGVGMLTATRTFIVHWNGHSWHTVVSPDPGAESDDNILAGAAVTARHEVWAVGFFTLNGSSGHTLAVRGSGQGWEHVASSP
jgi:hypothetical protein